MGGEETRPPSDRIRNVSRTKYRTEIGTTGKTSETVYPSLLSCSLNTTIKQSRPGGSSEHLTNILAYL